MFPKGRNMQSGRSRCVEGLKIRRFFESLFLGVRMERFNRPFPIACAVALAFPFAARRDTSGTAFARCPLGKVRGSVHAAIPDAILGLGHSKAVSPQR